MPLFKFNLHRQKAKFRLPLLFGVLLIFLGVWGSASGCRDDGAGRYAYHVARSSGIFGTSQRLTVTSSAGWVRACEGTDDLHEICVRSGGPFVRIRVSNGNIDATSALLRVTNLPINASWQVYLEPLLPDEPQDQRCARDQLGPPPESSTRLADEEGEILLTSLAGCSSLIFIEQAPSDRENDAYRIALLGGATLRDTELEGFVQRVSATEPAPDFYYFVDLVELRNVRDSLDTVEEIMRRFELPWSMVIAPRHLRSGYEHLVEKVGSLDYHTRVFGVPFVVLDTADAKIRAPQKDMLQRLRACEAEECVAALALMSIPPVGTHKMDVGIFRSQALAQDLLYLLESTGVRAIASSAEKEADNKRFSRFQLFDVGSFQPRTQYLAADFIPAASGQKLCDSKVSILSDSRISVAQPRSQCDVELSRCVSGVCVPTCAHTDECPSPLHVCTDDGLCLEPCANGICSQGECTTKGYCNDGPRLNLSWQKL